MDTGLPFEPPSLRVLTNATYTLQRIYYSDAHRNPQGRRLKLNYEEEKKRYVSFCGSYCKTCDWFTGKIRRTFQLALDMVKDYGFRTLLDGKVDIENFEKGLHIIANSSIDSGCKADIAEKPEDDRCEIRQCCFRKGFDLCSECSNFPCDLLKKNPGVIKFHCIENLTEIKEKGIECWIDKQWKNPSDWLPNHPAS